ncbi:MAG: site-specific integrase [Candidatus Aminicenantes bacterium]|nr:site-specific integrase [Candidatus Aminicenantes bacterium]
MRKAEIANLQWIQVDLINREIEVVRTKSGKKRVIPISEDLHQMLRLLREKKENSDFVFQYVDQKTGKRKHLRFFRRSFENACRRAKIGGFTFHDLRHTFASRLVRAGVDLITVKDLLGHFSVRTTERYTHSNQEQKRKAVELLSKNKGGKKPESMLDLSLIVHMEEKEKLERLVTH